MIVIFIKLCNIINLTLLSFPVISGVLSKGHVRCPWHGACFNIATGDIEDFPGLDSLPTFQVTFPTSAVFSHIPCLIMSLSTFKKFTRLFAPGQS